MGSPVEEGGKLAGSIVNSMQGNPLCLALLVMNAGLLGYLFYAEHNATVNRAILFREIMDGQQSVREVLSHCIVPPRLPGG